MSGEDQTATLRKLAESVVVALRPPRRRVVAVTGGKGGVGKSTVAVNLAVSYARRGTRTLALDGDLGMADLNLLLGLAPERSLLDVLNGCPVEDVLVEAHGIHLLPALNGSHHLANLDAAARRKLMEAIDLLGERFEALIVDVPAGIGASAMELAAAAPEIVVVATPEPLSLADAYACLKVLATRHGVTRAFLLPNAVRSPSQADEIVSRLSALVDRFLGIGLSPLPPVPWDPSVGSAAAAGVPVVLHSPDSPASRALLRTARRIDGLLQPVDRPSVLPRFLHGALPGGSPEMASKEAR